MIIFRATGGSVTTLDPTILGSLKFPVTRAVTGPAQPPNLLEPMKVNLQR